MENNKRRIASLALFRNLYNEGRSDIMTILSEFVKYIIYSKRLTSFTPTQIRNELKSEYEFHIPEYVVETVLKKFCRKDNSRYCPNESILSQKVTKQEIDKIEESHVTIISKLISFIEEKTSKQLSDKEKEILIQSLCGFLIDESNVEYSEYISSFIIEIQKDTELSQLLRTIKEGVVLYTGIQYNDNINEIGSWKDDFTIYVEREILFHMAGYNGVLYQNLFQDFWNLIGEINQKAHKQLIKVKYFDAVKIEIDRFFTCAERIVEGKDTLDCSNIAMSTIVQGCESKSDVVSKKCAFFDLLKNNRIDEEDGDSYFKKNSAYNIYYEENLNHLSNDFPERNIDWSLKLLNYISMIRKGVMSGFEKSRCILLTGNSTTISIANHNLIKQNGNVPLAITLDYITNKLWFKLNKGFGNNVYPKTFDIVTKAQIVLSSQIAGSVSQEFEKIKKEISSNEKPESIIIAELAELKTRVKKPEDIKEESLDEILDTISCADTEKYLRERDMERKEAMEQKEAKVKIESEKLRLEQEKEENERKNQEIIKKQNDENTFLKERLLKQLDEQIIEIKENKEKADAKVEKHIKGIKWIPWSIVIGFVVLMLFCTYKYGWDKMEFIAWVISGLVSSIPYLFFAIVGKSINPQKIIEVKCKNKYRHRIYKEYHVDLSKLRSLEEEKNNL